jgi:hypothetical protein
MTLHGSTTDRTADFHAHHAPVGALASFTVGRFDGDNGPGCEIGKAIPGGGVFAGYRDGDGPIQLLPFFRIAPNERARYGLEAGAKQTRACFAASEIRRDYGWCTDRWSAGDLQLSILSPLGELPDPATASRPAARDAFCPAVSVRLVVRNPARVQRTAVFALSPGGEKWLPLPERNGLQTRSGLGLACAHPGARWFTNFDIEGELNRTHVQPLFGLGHVGGLLVEVPAGGEVVLDLAIAWYRPGPATAGRSMAYWYTRLFSGLDDVVAHQLARTGALVAACAARDAELAAARLDDEQRFVIAHATRGYYASTQLLDDAGRPRWVVNEGEYLMMNTFDLTVDMAFHELRYHPWALANVLEQFATDYSYRSRVFHPSDPGRLLPGGVAFAHDMGVTNIWSADGRSSYEIDGLDRACFSHMSCEELLNWVLCAGVYWAKTRDRAFLDRHAGLIGECQRSILNRDHPEPAKRRGWMQCEDERCRGGGEITTYDSLDHSLGQSRANLYLAVKMWSAHVALAALLRELGRDGEAAASDAAAQLTARAVCAAADPATGLLPALLEGGTKAPIIPAIEGLAYPWYMGLKAACSDAGPYGAMIAALRRHLQAALREGVCLYPDGGWKLSASADNSWASKIHLCQYVGRAVLGVRQDAVAARRADRAHADWQRIGAADHAVSDQFRSGRAHGSLYYPRIVTAVLWLDEA